MPNLNIFISASTDDFSGFRESLAAALEDDDEKVIRQETLPDSPYNLLTKLAGLVTRCHLITHIVGPSPGAPVAEQHWKNFTASTDSFKKSLCGDHELWQRIKEAYEVGELTYTHWEIYVAIHEGILVLPYEYVPTGRSGNDTVQSRHIARVSRFLQPKHFTKITDVSDAEIKRIRNGIRSAVQDPRVTSRAIRQAAYEAEVSKYLRPVLLDCDKPVGRESEISELECGYRDDAIRVIVLEGPGGVGKSTLLQDWRLRQEKEDWQEKYTYVFGYTFADPDADQSVTGIGHFIEAASEFFGTDVTLRQDSRSKAKRFAERICNEPILLILDGLEPILTHLDYRTFFADDAAHEFFATLLSAASCRGKVVISSYWTPQLFDHNPKAKVIKVGPLIPVEAANLLRALGFAESDPDIGDLFKHFYQHTAGMPLEISLLAASLKALGRNNYKTWKNMFSDGVVDIRSGAIEPRTVPFAESHQSHLTRILAFLDKTLQSQKKPRLLQMIRLFCLLVRPEDDAIRMLLDAKLPGLSSELPSQSSNNWTTSLKRLEELGLMEGGGNVHGRVREYFARAVQQENPVVWGKANCLLYLHYRKRVRFRGQAGLEAAKQAVLHACRAGLMKSAFRLFQRHLNGKHKDDKGTRTLDNYPETSHSENLATLSHFFVPGDWKTLNPEAPRKGLTGDEVAELIKVAAFSLRTQGRLTLSRECYFHARKIRTEMPNQSENGMNFSEICILHGLISKVDLLQGNFRQALAEANNGCQAVKPSKNDYPKVYTANFADLGSAQLHLGDDQAARDAFLESRDPAIYAEYDILYAERMIQYAEFLIDQQEFDEVENVLSLADKRCEAIEPGASVPRFYKKMQLDYALNGYVWAKLLVERCERELWPFLYGGRPVPNDADVWRLRLLELIHDPIYSVFRRKRKSRVTDDNANMCYGDLMFAIHDLEAIQRHDWLPKVYGVAAACYRLLARLETSEADIAQRRESSKHYLDRIQQILNPGSGTSIDRVEMKGFFVDYLFERARFELCAPSLTKAGRDDAKKLLNEVVKHSRKLEYGRYTRGQAASRLERYREAALPR